MPNFSIPSALRGHIASQACGHADKARDLALTGFPLTVAQVQDAVLDRQTQEDMRALVNKGVRTIQKYREIRLAFLRDKIPNLKRGVVLKLTLPSAIFVANATHYGIGTTEFKLEENHYLVPDLDHLAPEEHDALFRWLFRALREERLYEIVVKTVDHVVRYNDALTPSMAHLHAIWPLLCTLVDPSATQWNSDREKFTKWRERLRNPPTRNLARYKPSALVMDKLARLIHAANYQITAGRMLQPVKNKPGDIVCEIEHWERVGNDLRFPDALGV